MSRAEGILEKSKSLLQENKFYEYEQKLKTLSSRYYNTGKFEEANELLIGGASDLIDNNQSNSAYALLNTALQELKNKNKELDEATKKKVFNIMVRAPWDKNKPSTITKILQWFYSKQPDQDFLRLICEDSLKNKEYYLTQRFLLRCENSNHLAIQMLNEWIQLGNVNEKELFVARFILLKLACGRVQDAKVLTEEYVQKLNYPIIHFLRLLVRAIEIKSEKAFDVLAETHRKTYMIDPSFESLIVKIGSVHFGKVSEQGGGFLDGFMKMFTEN